MSNTPVSIGITVNGEKHDIPAPNMLVHKDIVKMAVGMNDPMEYTQSWTCSYNAKGIEGGTLYHGGPGVRPLPGMHFTIVNTGSA